MDDIIQCGNDLRLLLWWIRHHSGDPRYSDIIGQLAKVTQGLVQVVASSDIRNAALAREFRVESVKALTASIGRLANVEGQRAA